MSCHIFQDMMQCSNAKGIITGNRDGVGLAANDCSDPDMAPGLADTLISDEHEASDQVISTTSRGSFIP